MMKAASVVVMEAVIAVRRGREGILCDAITTTQEESQENTQDPEALDRILVEHRCFLIFLR